MKTNNYYITSLFLVVLFTTIAWTYAIGNQNQALRTQQNLIDGKQNEKIYKHEAQLDKNEQEHNEIKIKLDRILDILINKP